MRIVTDEQQWLASFTMKNLEEILPPDQFIRIHKSFIAALGHIKMIKTDTVIMAGEHSLPLSMNHKENLLDRFRA